MTYQEPVHYLTGVASYLPEGRLWIEDLVGQNKIDPTLAQEYAYLSLSAAGLQESPMTMALDVAGRSLKASGLNPGDIDQVIFTSLLNKDFFAWSGAAHLCQHLGIPAVPFLDIYQGCNGLMAAIETARSTLISRPTASHVLVIASESFPSSTTCRYSCDIDTWYGDGAAAAIVSKEPLGEQSYQIVGDYQKYNGLLNDMIYVDNPFLETSSNEESDAKAHPSKMDFKITKKAFFSQMSPQDIGKFYSEANREAAQHLLGDGPRDQVKIIFQNFSRRLLDTVCESLEVGIHQTSWDFGRRIGHVGSADPLINLHHSEFQDGTHSFIVSHGAGASVYALLLRAVGES